MIARILFCLLFINFPCYAATDASVLSFSSRVKNEIERIFREGQMRYDYDMKRNLERTWVDRNISAKDMENLLEAYNIAHDLERKVRLSNELKASKYQFTDFPEHVSPIFPLKVQ